MARKKSGPPEDEGKITSHPDDLLSMLGDEKETPSNGDVEIVKIQNVGPIAYAEIPIPKTGGGILVLRGDSGTGKSEVINMIDALITKDGKLVPRDLAAKGSVTGFDLSINVGGTTTRKGEGEVATLDASKFTFTDLVDPPLAGLEQRHARRIQALIGLSGVAPDFDKFIEVAGGKAEFEKLLTPKEQAIRDPVTLAGKLKDAIDGQARDLETVMKNEIVNQKAAEAAAKGVDVTKPHDSEKLQDALVEAVNVKNGLEATRAAYEKAVETAELAQEQLSEQGGRTGDRYDRIVSQREAAITTRNAKATEQSELYTRIEQMKQQAEQLGEEIGDIDGNITDLDEELKSIQAEKDSIEKWRAQIVAAQDVKNATDEELDAADQAVEAARAAVDLGSTIRTAIAKTKEAEEIAAKNKKREKVVAMLRDKAKNIFSALSDMIPKGPLYVVAGELVADTADREAEPYERLSTGERWELALPYAITAVGDGGYVLAQQDAFQHLSSSSRKRIADLCEKTGVWLITGEVSDGELRAEVFKPKESAASGT